MEILSQLANLASSIETIEGNVYTYHELNEPASEMVHKQENLKIFARTKKRILEIGFNAGHSACIMLEANLELEMTCIDIGIHKYVLPCYELVKERFGDRIKLIISSSSELPSLDIPVKSFDGVHVDGNHRYPWYINDTINCIRFMTDRAQLIMDDTDNSEIYQWVQYCLESPIFTLAYNSQGILGESSDLYIPTERFHHKILNFIRPKIAVYDSNDYSKCDFVFRINPDSDYSSGERLITFRNETDWVEGWGCFIVKAEFFHPIAVEQLEINNDLNCLLQIIGFNFEP